MSPRSMVMAQKARLSERWREAAHVFSQTLQTWPWLDTVRTLRERFREDRLGLTASSLTFTTLIALVPLVTVMLAVFTAFPMFGGFQVALERYFVQNLVPPTIAQPVLKAITQFTLKAAQLGSAGLIALVVTALALVMTIDRTLNAIWRVRRKRALTQRVLIYWAALTLGPVLVGMSLTLMTYALANTTRSTRSMSSGAEFVLATVEFLLFVVGVAALYRFVPNTFVRWRHAFSGAVVVAIGVQIAKRALAWWVSSTPLYTSVYGAFAAVPVFLLWLYVLWVIVLLGAVIAAYAPSLSMRIVRQPNVAGHRFSMALAVLRSLAAARDTPTRGLAMDALGAQLRTDPLVAEPAVEALMDLQWVGRLDEDGAQRLVLLVDPVTTSAKPLIDRLLLMPQAASDQFRTQARLDSLRLAQLL